MSNVVEADANVGRVGQTDAVWGIGVGVGSSGQDLWVSLGFPPLAAEEESVVGVGVSAVDSAKVAGDWDVGVVDTGGGFEGEAVGKGRVEGASGVEVGWVGLGLSLGLGVDSGHKGKENNLDELQRIRL